MNENQTYTENDGFTETPKQTNFDTAIVRLEGPKVHNVTHPGVVEVACNSLGQLLIDADVGYQREHTTYAAGKWVSVTQITRD